MQIPINEMTREDTIVIMTELQAIVEKHGIVQTTHAIGKIAMHQAATNPDEDQRERLCQFSNGITDVVLSWQMRELS